MKILTILLVIAAACFAQAPSVVIVTTNGATSGSGNPLPFQVGVYDPHGTSDIQYIFLVLGTNGPSGCVVVWQPFNNWVGLLTDDATNWDWAYAPTGTTLQNNQCSFNSSSATAALNGNVANANVIVAAKASYAGNKQISGIAQGLINGPGNWYTGGTWTIPGLALSSPSAVAVNPHVNFLDDATGTYIERPTSISPWIVKLKDGRRVHIEAADNIKMSKLDVANEPVGDGYMYHFTADTTDNPYIMRLGLVEDDAMTDWNNVVSTQPKGWYHSGAAWINRGTGELSKASEFTKLSKWRPGLLPVFVMSQVGKNAAPSFTETENNLRIASVVNIFDNSLRKFVIGPAIKPNITAAELKQLITRWVEDYGFTFLQPIVDGKTLADVKAAEGFESEVLQCLKEVIPQA